MSGPPFGLVTFDLDGTLARGHGWRFLASALGRSSEFNRSEAQFLSGEIGEEAHLVNLLSILRGVEPSRLGPLLEATPKYEGIGPAVRTLRSRGLRTALLTHNPDPVVAWYRERFGFDDGAGCGAVPMDGPVFARPSTARADKVEGLLQLLARAGLSRAQTIHLGDGRADAAIFRIVGYGIATNSTRPEVLRAADADLGYRDLQEALPVIESARPRRL